jgi:hypothetical protein
MLGSPHFTVYTDNSWKNEMTNDQAVKQNRVKHVKKYSRIFSILFIF